MTDEELIKRFPNNSVCAYVAYWKYSHKDHTDNDYHITFFSGKDCVIKYGNSFEDCLAQLDQENEDVNNLIKQRSILLRKFNI